jgi:phosphotransferase system HPr (HPr) family protein
MQKKAHKAVTRTILIPNETGLHARPASELVRCVMRYKSQVTIQANSRICSGISIMDIMTADIRQGAKVVVTAEGVDAELTLDAIEKCINEFAQKGF